MSSSNPFAPGASGEGHSRPESGNGVSSASGAGDAQDVVAHGRSGRLRVAPDPDRDLICCRLPLTDMGNAERWRVRFGADFRFCPELGWLAWDGRRWKLLSEEKDQVPAPVTWSIARTVRAIRNEAALVAASGFEPLLGLSDKEQHDLDRWSEATETANRQAYLRGLARDLPEMEAQVAQWIGELDPLDQLLDVKKGKLWSSYIEAHAKKSEAAGAVAATVKWIKGFPDIVVRTDQLDQDRMAINVLNGTLRLVKGNEKRPTAEVEAGKSVWHSVWKIRKMPHDRADLITKLAPVKYAPNATCRLFDAFIERMQPEPAMRRFLDQWGGYSLVGDTTEHKLAFFYGEGRNGKGTWVEAVAHLAGDYAGSIDFSSLAENVGKRRGDQATPDIACLPGVRFLRVSEPEKGARLNDGLIKQFTGGDPVKARLLHKGFFEFFPDFKMTISGNSKPNIRDLSHGMWSRMQLVPWDVIISEAEKDLELPAKLKAEAAGIFARLIRGLIDWRNNGLIVPEQVREATQAYRDESDDLGRFLTALCEVGPKCRVGAKEFHELYVAYAEHAGTWLMNIKQFKTEMENKRFVQKASDGMKWLGVQPRAGVVIDDVKRGVWPARQSEAEARASDPGGGGVGDDGSGLDDGEDWLPPEWEGE